MKREPKKKIVYFVIKDHYDHYFCSFTSKFPVWSEEPRIAHRWYTDDFHDPLSADVQRGRATSMRDALRSASLMRGITLARVMRIRVVRVVKL